MAHTPSFQIVPYESGRITSDGTWTYVHDAEGNITKKTQGVNAETWTYGYDHRNQMIWAEKRATDGGTLQMRADYEYDVFGNRVEKRVDPDGVGGQGTTTTRFAHEMWQTGRVPGAGRRATRTGTLGDRAELDGSNNLTRRFLHGDAVDQLFARIGSRGAAAWYLTDRMGSVRDIVNASGWATTVINHIEYDSFGNITAETGTPYGDRLKYTGREWSAGTGLYYYRARWYDPATGRFMSEDPSGFADGPNRWIYVTNNPLTLVDPSGLALTQVPLALIFKDHFRQLLKQKAADIATLSDAGKAYVESLGKLDFNQIADSAKKLAELFKSAASVIKDHALLAELTVIAYFAVDERNYVDIGSIQDKDKKVGDTTITLIPGEGIGEVELFGGLGKAGVTIKPEIKDREFNDDRSVAWVRVNLKLNISFGVLKNHVINVGNTNASFGVTAATDYKLGDTKLPLKMKDGTNKVGVWDWRNARWTEEWK